MALYNVLVSRERHYVENCVIQIEASSGIEAEEKALKEAENDGCWEWCDSLDDDCGEMQIDEVEEVEENYDYEVTGGHDREVRYLGTAEVIVPYHHAAGKSLSKKPKAPPAVPIDQ